MGRLGSVCPGPELSRGGRRQWAVLQAKGQVSLGSLPGQLEDSPKH